MPLLLVNSHKHGTYQLLSPLCTILTPYYCWLYYLIKKKTCWLNPMDLVFNKIQFGISPTIVGDIPKRATLVTHVSMAENRQASDQEHNRHGQIIVIPSVQQLDGVLDQAVLGAAWLHDFSWRTGWFSMGTCSHNHKILGYLGFIAFYGVQNKRF